MFNKLYLLKVKQFFEYYLNRSKRRRRDSKFAQVRELVKNLTGETVNGYEGEIFVVGDSHVGFFSGDTCLNYIPFDMGIATTFSLIPIFRVFFAGSGLAYNLTRHNTTTGILEKTEFLFGMVPKNSTVMLSFGEIDSRFHVRQQAEKTGKTIDEVVDGIIGNYCVFVKKLKAKGFKVICWGPIPQRTYGNGDEKTNLPQKIFNTKLQEFCEKENIGFCTVFNCLPDSQYNVDDKYYCDDVHLSQEALGFALKEMLERKLLAVKKGRLTVNVQF